MITFLKEVRPMVAEYWANLSMTGRYTFTTLGGVIIGIVLGAYIWSAIIEACA